MQEKEKFIDIEKVIAGKSPRLLKLLPHFIIHYLKRIIHEEEINEILSQHGEKKGVEFIDAVLKLMDVTYRVEGIENISQDGRYLFASNHPLGGLDGMILIHLLGQEYPEVKFPVNDLLMHLKQLHSVFIPVNKHGSQSSENARILEQAYASDSQILYFPAGLCSRKQKGAIEDLEWKKSFITKALRHQRDIVPIYFSGQNSNFFYNLAKIRAFFGIKANIEMIYLVDEMFRQKGKSIVVKIGKPISYKYFDNSLPPQGWANWVKYTVYEMAQNT
ncbi:MAG: 1-acyl-sn-glycerol-3-phosphate acyltransferase [Bacteroidales bacterium]|nr:1-acyl-sn-glycerol-3-phosphate acyltransferase [Bacteroidales bacterium]